MPSVTFQDWQAALVGGLSAFATALFARLHYRRQQSKDALAEAQDTVSRVYVADIARERDQALAKAADYFERFVKEQRRADMLQVEVHSHSREIERLQHQVARLTKVLIGAKPEAKDFLSGFGGLER